VQLGGAFGLRALNERLLIGPEVWASTVVSDDGDGLLRRKTTPFEAIMGAHYDVTPRWRVGGGVGPGLSRGLGTPAVRVLASVEWVPGPIEEPPSPPPDSDLDGILDTVDACPTDRGEPNDDPALHGCPPPPSDRDGDGIIDAKDACPDEPGEPDSENPERHGCPPPPDRDGDGIIDEQDACPEQAGPESDDPERHGCPPPPDRDGDGIIDEQDACPERPGPESDDPKRHGCPKAIVEDSSIRILERIEFDTGKATLRPESDAVLQAVADILKKYADITKVSVEGHTDNRGAARFNRGLSRRRAASVVAWLVARGIEAKRLSSKGFGADKPIDSNQTDEGRQNNRRVEFKILDAKN
jgi:outer membrane protein OmpA-like peptidoglycan-associated protein